MYKHNYSAKEKKVQDESGKIKNTAGDVVVLSKMEICFLVRFFEGDGCQMRCFMI
jgi:hypothetical protein